LEPQFHIEIILSSYSVKPSEEFGGTTLTIAQVVTGIARLFRVVIFRWSFLVTFFVDNAAINVNGDGSELAPLEQSLEDLEIDLSQHFCGLVTEVPHES
jgi:hypothetical protein